MLNIFRMQYSVGIRRGALVRGIKMLLDYCLIVVVAIVHLASGADDDYNVIHADGSAEFGYETPDSYHHAQANRNNVVRGEFGSRSPKTGAIDSTIYTAGPRGFRPRGKNVVRKFDLNQSGPRPVGSRDDPYFDPYEDPSYDFAFRTRTYSRKETANRIGDVSGSYTYLDDVGERHNVEFIAGKRTGFHVKTPYPDSNPRAYGPLYFRGRGRPIPRGRTSIQRGLDGSYKFVSAGPDQRRTETSDSTGHVRGSYTYLDDKGVQHSVHYIAGPETGYRVLKNVKGPHLPTVFPFGHPDIIPPDFYDYKDPGDVFDVAPSGHVKPRPKPGRKGGGVAGEGAIGEAVDVDNDDFDKFKNDLDKGDGGGRPSRPNRPRPSKPTYGDGDDASDSGDDFGDIFGSKASEYDSSGKDDASSEIPRPFSPNDKNTPIGSQGRGAGGGVKPKPGGDDYFQPSGGDQEKPSGEGGGEDGQYRPEVHNKEDDGRYRPSSDGGQDEGGFKPEPQKPDSGYGGDYDGNFDGLFPSRNDGKQKSQQPVLNVGGGASRRGEGGCRKCSGTIVTNVGDAPLSVPPGVSIRAHVQSIDLRPILGKAPSPSEQYKHETSIRTEQLNAAEDKVVISRSQLNTNRSTRETVAPSTPRTIPVTTPPSTISNTKITTFKPTISTSTFTEKPETTTSDFLIF